ncbi:SCO family protein [Pararhodobacter sp. SW119]|uniref:SCO family protein n=1 Tax=Pararhodobacter sp. SW119 TaxID=2780075 RepID=UPI001ADF41FD|nr:SCO family protein [Pararhodobacter sp. SW119]
MIRYYSIGAAAFVAVLLGVLGWLVLADRDGDRFAQCRATSIAGGSGSIGGPFELIDQTGRTVTEADVLSEPALIYFGYTFCPDVCPLDTARNALAVELLEERGHNLRPVFISVDPRRDTPEVLAEFASIFHPRMIGLTGSEAQVRAAAREYRAFYNVHEAEDDFYLVDHSTFTYLMLPGEGFVEVFRRDDTAPDMADRIACFLDRL